MVYVVQSGGKIMGIRMVVHPRSTASNMSLAIFKSAVFVERSFLYADWREYRDCATCGNSQAKYIRSSTLMVVIFLISAYNWLVR